MKKNSTALFVLLLSGCSMTVEHPEDIQSHEIYQSYSVIYTQENNKTLVRAEYLLERASGPSLRLGGKCSISHGKYKMNFPKPKDGAPEIKPGGRLQVAPGVFYEGDGVGFDPNHSLIFTDVEGKAYLNTATIVPIDFPEGFPDKFRQSEDLVVSWKGDRVAPGETVSVYLEETSRRIINPVLVSVSTVGADSVTIPSSKLIAGKKTLRLVRQAQIPLKEITEVGGKLWTTYTTSKKSVTIE